jgi:hypothetical protein
VPLPPQMTSGPDVGSDAHLAMTIVGTAQALQIPLPPVQGSSTGRTKGEGSGAQPAMIEPRPWDVVALPAPVVDYRIRSNTTWVVLSLMLLLGAIALVVYAVMTT